MSRLRIREVDENGQQRALYASSGSSSSIELLDDKVKVQYKKSWKRRLQAVFLPTGYPASVSADYTAYHVYNALQSFASSAAGVLAGRAVLQGMGVGDKNASATQAMLLNMLQDSISRVATIMFAHRVGARVEAECKMYRLLADILNDIAMVFDCLSPMLPKVLRVSLLCVSGISRALCGVAGASSKATLSAHFARGGNIGELSAKDSSQETIVSLVGLWAGGAIGSWATSATATWVWLVALLTSHLLTNYLAVTSVSVPLINRQRANIIFSSLMSTGHAPSPDQVAQQEHIFEKGNVLRWSSGKVIGTCEMGVPFTAFLHRLAQSDPIGGYLQDLQTDMSDVCAPLADEQYLLWIDAKTRKADIVLGVRASVLDQLKAWSHALRAMQEVDRLDGRDWSGSEMQRLVQSTRQAHRAVFDAWIQRIQDAGWQAQSGTSALENTKANRVVLDQ